jgi:putative membrane protein
VGCSDDSDDTTSADSSIGKGGSVSDAAAGSGTTARTDSGVGAGMDASITRDAGPSADATAAAALTEGQVVGVAAAINMGEIQAGTLAQTKASTTPARDFASMMVTMHTAAQARQTALGIAPAASPTQTMVTTMATSTLQSLQSVPAGPEFDRAYIQSQVTMHTSARDLIDSTLLPNATTAALRDELTRTRGEVVMHLTEATSILSTLGDGGVTGGDAGTGADAGSDAGGADAGGDAGT